MLGLRVLCGTVAASVEPQIPSSFLPTSAGTVRQTADDSDAVRTWRREGIRSGHAGLRAVRAALVAARAGHEAGEIPAAGEQRQPEESEAEVFHRCLPL